MRAAAVIVAAGRGDRLGRGGPKALVELGGRPLLAHVLDRFRESGLFEVLVVVAPPEAVDRCRGVTPHATDGGLVVVPGGRRRQDSVRLGLEALPDGIELVAVHDAARPLVPVDLIRRTLEVAYESGAAIAALPVTDTVKEVDAQGRVVGQVPRDRLWRAQTPQAFRLALLREAHARSVGGEEATDDAALVARLGHSVRVVRGAETNLKITVPEDLAFAETLLRGEVARQLR